MNFTKPERKRLNEIFKVNRKGELINKIDRGQARKGQRAGSLSGNGYLYVRYDGRIELVSRIIYAMHNDRTIRNEIDHKDGNRLNNRPSNLRDVTHTENMNNLSCHRKGKKK